MRRLLIGMALLSGCVIRHGESMRDVTPAAGARGVEAEVHLLTTKNVLTGELVLVTDSALYLLRPVRSDGEIWRIYNKDIASARFGKLKFAVNPLRDDLSFQKVRLRSRYSQGLSPELLAKLLSAYHQTEPRHNP